MNRLRRIVNRRDKGVFLGAVFVLLIAGCQLPNVQPYADATVQLRDAIEATGEVTIARVKGDDNPFDSESAPEPGDPDYEAWELAQLWQVRLAAADALLAYADALADITAAGKAAGDNARQVGNVITEIAGDLPGVSAPSSEVVALAVKLGEAAIKVKAARDLAQAVERAQPAVEGIADVLENDLDDMLSIYQVAYRDHVEANFLIGDPETGNEYLRLATYHMKLRAKVEAVRKELADADFANPAGRDLIGEVQEAEQLLATAEAAWRPYGDQFQALRRERRRVEALFTQAKRATAAWVKTHGDLAEAIRNNRRPNWRELVKVAAELHVLVDAVRAAESPLAPTDIQ